MPRATSTIPAINFFRQHRRQLAVLQKQDKLILWISLGVFAVVGLISAGLIVYAFSQSRQNANLQQEDEQTTRTLKGLATQEAQYLVYSARLKSLADVLDQRGSQKDTLHFLSQLATPGVDFQSVTFEQGSRTLQFTVSSEDYFIFESFIEHLRQPQIREQITEFNMKNVSRTDEGK